MVHSESDNDHVAYILLGSNIGDRLSHLESAVEMIEVEVGKVVRQSSVYETPAVGIKNGDKFLNQAIEVHTSLHPEALLTTLLAIETHHGRTRTGTVTSRTLDLDIGFFDEVISRSDALTIPHPRLQDRRFALAPLAEIAPDMIHPQLQFSLKELLKICPDQSEVSIFSRR